MAKPKRTDTGAWTPSQVVAHNMARARQLRGLTQAEIAERLSTFTGAPWSDVTVAQAEGSVSGKRVRQFTANELVGLARTFDLPVLYFFLPPEDGAGKLGTPDAGDMAWEYLVLLVLGHRRNFPDVAARAAPWAHASTILVPPDDVVDPDDESYLVRESQRRRQYLTPQDMLALAFNGMARAQIRGSFAGEDLLELASNLRRLANAFEAFNNYAPGTFFDTETLRSLADKGPGPRKSAPRKQ
ncbi:MAG: helix-turn-helix domain-containing protein [Acidimicrobiales bacterium]